MSLSRASLLSAALAGVLLVASPRSAAADPPPPRDPPPAASSSSSPELRTAGVVSIVIGATLVLGGVALALSGVALKSKVDRECPNKVCPAAASGDLDSLRGRASSANVFWVAGLVTAASGIGLVIASGTSERESPGERRGAIVITPSVGGLAASMAFLSARRFCAHDRRPVARPTRRILVDAAAGAVFEGGPKLAWWVAPTLEAHCRAAENGDGLASNARRYD